MDNIDIIGNIGNNRFNAVIMKYDKYFLDMFEYLIKYLILLFMITFF